MKKRRRSNTLHRGFGLIELLVSISVMLVVMAVILVRHSSFNSAVLLRNQAYEVALDTRETQVNAVSAVGTGAGNNFRSSLGVYFSSNAAINDSYRIYRDADNDKFYDSNEEFGLQNTLDKRFEVRSIRVKVGNVTSVVTDIAVVFERPNYDARFFRGTGEVLASKIEIDIGKRGMAGDPADAIRTVEVTATGQIAVL